MISKTSKYYLALTLLGGDSAFGINLQNKVPKTIDKMPEKFRLSQIRDTAHVADGTVHNDLVNALQTHPGGLRPVDAPL